ncbi:MAG TPA: transporter, partial [Leptospiraceae bacterium]|nr:transporter [Leptospiraceae bacterium]HNO24330.1 transporter [Leptospiraceae bacterium]
SGLQAVEINSDEALRWLKSRASSSDSNEFIWLHFSLANTASLSWMKEYLDLPETFFEAVHIGSRSTRIEYTENTLTAVINDLLYDFSYHPSEISTLVLNAGKQVMVSARLRPLRSVDRLKAAVSLGEKFHSTAELLAHLLRDQEDMLVQIMRDTTVKVDEIEDRILGGRLSAQRKDLGAMRRLLVRIQRLLAPEPASLFRLLHHPPDWMSDSDVSELRVSTEEFSSVLNDLTGLQERIKLLQEEIAALVEEDNKKSLFLLTVVTVLALPINITAGLMGMNVGGIPFASHPSGFWIVASLSGMLTFIAGWIIYNRMTE